MHMVEWLEKNIIADRVRQHTAVSAQRELDERLVARLHRYANNLGTADGEKAITARIDELEHESDIERLLEANAAALALTGTVLAGTHHRRWLWLPGVVTAFLLQHAIQGWCPPISVMRRMGIRTRKEIDIELCALKVLRGDFDASAQAHDNSASTLVQWTLTAVAR